MTSVGVIWSAVARINCLKALQKEPEISLPDEAEELLKGLEEVKELLVAAYDYDYRKLEAVGAELEKQVVRLSYEIVDAIADASFKPRKEMFSVRKPTQWSRSGNARLGELQKKLQGFKGKLNNPGSAGPEQNPGSEIQEQKPKKKLTIPWKKSGNTKLMRLVEEDEVEKKNPASPRSEQNPVQQQELLNQLKAELLNPDSSSEVYLVGESGMGKTTLAKELIIDQHLRSFFEVFAWVPIAHNFQIKGVLQSLLQKLIPHLDIREMNEIELIARIFAHLKNKKYLIVLDDINTADDWESIRLALPIAKSARVLITTSSQKIGLEKKDHRHLISGLSKTDILKLLNKEAGFKPGSERVGEAIYEISGGSPLFAIILGNSLGAEAAASTESEQQLVDELPSYDSVKGTPQVLVASYKRLAPKLKPCLLYLGQFPPGQDIQVDNLYLLLMAENLISPEVSEKSGQYLRKFLDELARLKLIHVQEDIVPTMTSGHYKSCRLHDQVRDFCTWKGSHEEFLEVVESPSSTKVGLHTRRLAVYLRGENSSIQFDSPDTVKKILSLLIFDTFESDVEKSEMNDLTEFVHLRILNYEGVNFKVRKILKGLDRLVLLRYLSFRGCLLEELPSSMSNLTQLETLDLRVQADCMIIPNNMFTNMKRMVHLYLPRRYRSSDGKTKVKLQNMEMLEILVNFDTEIFDVEALSRLKNLKILSTISKAHSKELAAVIKFLKEGGAQQHSSVKITSFDCYDNSSAPELKELLQCRFLHSVHIQGRIGELPKEEAAETVIGEIFLDGSELQLDPMAYLGKFQNLRRLVLWNDAFLGTHIHISATPLFPNLRSLELQKLQFLEKLTIEEEAMPKLSNLKIDGCGCLLELFIPKGMDRRLEKAQRDNGGDAYSVMPRPPNFKIT